MGQRRFALAFVCLVFFASSNSPLSAKSHADEPSPSQLANLSGEFSDPAGNGVPIDFYAQNGKLIYENMRHVPVELTPVSASVFTMSGSKAQFRFWLDASGHAASVTLSNGSESTEYRRSGDAVHHVFHTYERSEAMIPMRDGVKLHAVILKPTDIAGPLPFLMQRTPYGVDDTSGSWFFAARPELARSGYIYVGEDIRGRYKSEGTFVMSRAMVDHRDPKAVDESTDAYDTVAWLLKNVPDNNGRVGVVGTSYPGFLAVAAGIDPHPAVKAISPQAPMIDVWMGDDFFHNGAFRQTYGYDYVMGLESNKQSTEVSYGKDSSGKPRDGYDYFLERGSFAQDVKKSGSKTLPTWQLFLDHPAYDIIWSSRGVEHHMDKVAVPTLSVGGYYDQEDMFGPQIEYSTLEPKDDKHENFLVLGPWRHGYWSSSAQHLGNVQFGGPIGDEFRANIEAKFFAHYLKDDAGFSLEDTASFQTGTNTWKYYSHFPPVKSEPTSLYLQGGNLLSWASPTTQQKTSYESDPANPIPYRHRPIQPTYSEGSQWFNWMTEDQRFVTDRKDVAVFKLPVLKKDLVVTGDVIADIFASTTGTDNDMVVKLIDQFPADDADPKMRGYQLMTNAEIFRGRYLASFDKPQPIRANSVREYRFSLHDIDHVFKDGHTVMVEIQSTWFPLYDRNPQTFVPNIMMATPADYKPATVTIYSDPDHQSNLQMPLMNACDHIDCF